MPHLIPNISDNEIIQEVRDYVDEGIRLQRIMDPAHITQALIKNHPDIHGKDRHFYLRCGYQHVRDVVRQVLGEYKSQPHLETVEQMVLEGFEHLQKAYLIKRKGKQLIVPIEKCTDKELADKADEYRKMSASCLKHALELDRYRADRGGSAAA